MSGVDVDRLARLIGEELSEAHESVMHGGGRPSDEEIARDVARRYTEDAGPQEGWENLPTYVNLMVAKTGTRAGVASLVPRDSVACEAWINTAQANAIEDQHRGEWWAEAGKLVDAGPGRWWLNGTPGKVMEALRGAAPVTRSAEELAARAEVIGNALTGVGIVSHAKAGVLAEQAHGLADALRAAGATQ